MGRLIVSMVTSIAMLDCQHASVTMENHPLYWEHSPFQYISIVISNSYVSHYQRVNPIQLNIFPKKVTTIW